MADTNPSDDPDLPEADEDAPTSVRDRWWWSPTVSVVIGLAMVGYQWGSLTGSGGNWLNWVVAAIGLALATSGVVRLVRAYPR